MQLINLTPHEVRVLDVQGNLLVVFPPTDAARVSRLDIPGKPIRFNGVTIPVFTTDFGSVDLPLPQKETFYIVSSVTALVAEASSRSAIDLLIPSGLVRDGAGCVIGCTGFAQV